MGQCASASRGAAAADDDDVARRRRHGADDASTTTGARVSALTKTTRPLRERYAYVDKLGHGAFGEVYAYASTTGTGDVAVKALDKQKLSRIRTSGGRTMMDDAVDEAELMALCADAHVVGVYEWCEDARENKAYIVMEFCERGALLGDDTDGFEPFEDSRVKAVIRDLLSALVVCHARGVVHYDVKPQNILVSASGAHKLGDFGSARRVEKNEHDGTYALVRTTPGTPAFTAPECCEGEPCDGFKADVWAVGVTAHALATGSYAYRAEGAWNTYQMILERDVDLSQISNQQCRNFLEAVLDRDPSSRLTAQQALEHAWLA